MNYLRTERKHIFYSILLGLTGGLVGVTIFGLSGYMISLSFFDPPFFIIILIIAVIKLFGMMKGAFRYIERLLSHEATFQMIGRLRLNYFKKSMDVKEDTHSVKFIQWLNHHFDQVEDYYIKIIYPYIVAALLSLILTILSFYIGIEIVILMAVTALFLLFAIPGIFEKLTYKNAEEREAVDTQFYMKLYHYIHDFTDLFVTKQIDGNKSKMHDMLYRIRKNEDKKSLYDAMMTFSARMIQIIGFIAAIILMYQESPLLVPMVLLLLISYFDMVMPVMEPASNYRTVKEAVNVLDKDENPSRAAPEEKQNISRVIIKDLNYRYPGSKRNVLDNINASFEKGRKYAIIGSSGSGKTTLLDRVIEGDESVRLYGHDNQNASGALITDASIMPQHLDFYNASIMDNVTMFGHFEASQNTVEHLLDELHIKSYRPDTMITHTGRLSGGEEKRLHFIRMMIEDKKWWIMDEPTARLDRGLKEKLWQEIFDKETVIVSTHDLSHLDEFDYIYYMEQGRIIEAGTYDALIAEQGETYHAIERFKDNL